VAPARPRVRDQLPLVELLRVEADRADEQFAPAGRILLEEPGQRRTSLTHDGVGHSRKRKANGLLRQEHRHLLTLVEGAACNEESDCDALSVVEACRKIDHDLLVLCHVYLLGVVGLQIRPRFVSGSCKGEPAHRGDRRDTAECDSCPNTSAPKPANKAPATSPVSRQKR